ncbi:MAG: hypothetical protein CML16_03235 [Pusillimonas sp.]|nr:hypothetical protein [Pusillimonas sp.]MBC43601.1 hypothetical protein [Pusillimonas sp.]HCP79398.1 hypothetical protein [Pusillimonas sp.]|tara:strand:- start:3486 stop:3998 length:513 start_codon:yes stop_codon:yes gene_type:complete
MLTFDNQTGQLNNLNLRAEKHGEESVTGADLKIHINVSNDFLSEFHPTLKSSFYRKPHPGEMDLLDQSEQEPSLNRLIFGNRISGFKWDFDVVGATFIIHFGTGGKSDLVLDEATIDGFQITLMDGGTIGLTFRVKCDPDEKQIAKLAFLIGHEIEFSMEPPQDSIPSEG